MNIEIFYFSGTGNTWWCAERLTECFREAGHTAEALSIEAVTRETTKELVSRADLVGFGYPIYGSDLPEPMKDFILGTLPALESPGKEVFVFCTQMMFSGDGGRVFEGELASMGYRTRWSIHLAMPNNVCLTVIPLPYTTNRRKINRRLKKTGKKIESFVKAVTAGRRYARGKGRFSTFLGKTQRNPYRAYFPRLRNEVSIDPEKCTLCNRCVNICPSGNLVREGEIIRTRGTCILCLRCYNFCPVQAVLFMKKPHRQRRGIPYRGPVPEFRPEDLT